MHQLLGEARRRVERRRVAATSRPACPVSSSSSRRAATIGILGGAVVVDGRASPAGISSRTRPAGDAELADEQHAVLVVERDDGHRARVAGDVARRARAVGALDGVDAERQVAALVDDPRLDDALDEIGPGGILRGRCGAVRAGSSLS